MTSYAIVVLQACFARWPLARSCQNPPGDSAPLQAVWCANVLIDGIGVRSAVFLILQQRSSMNNMQRHPTPACKAAHAWKAAHAYKAGFVAWVCGWLNSVKASQVAAASWASPASAVMHYVTVHTTTQ
jgi:hypothetical protein